MLECSIIPPSSGRTCGKGNEIPCCFMLLLHDYLLKLNLSLDCVIEKIKVEFEFGLE
jgi:hypothetical protein